jgi:BirA family biotin operon repressor/biotin-[acetyl-CoA-carboxylase] ligase
LRFALPEREAPTSLPPDMRDALAASRGDRGAFGEPLFFYASLGSTNDAAARLAEAGASEGTTVVAEEQTSGRGRSGRAWFSAPGAGLYVSVVIRPGGTPSAPGKVVPGTISGSGKPARPAEMVPGTMFSGVAVLTLAAGVALATAVRDATGLQAAIKWPNDLLCGRRKLAGILAEASARGTGLDAIVLGFGLNVRTVGYPPDLADRATSIEAELGHPVDRGLVLALALARLAAAREALRRGETAAVLEEWRRLAPSSVGRAVSWQGPAGERRGTTAGIDADGALLVDDGGVRERIIAGDVIWR